MQGWNRKDIQSLKDEISQCHFYSADGRFHRILLSIEDSLDALDSYLARAEVSSMKELAKKEEEELLPYGVHAWESLQEKVERARESELAATDAIRPNLKVYDNEMINTEEKGDNSNNE